MSGAAPVCDHRVYEVVIMFETCVIFGVVVGAGLAVLGASLLGAVCAGGAAVPTCFGVGMAAIAYVKRQVD